MLYATTLDQSMRVLFIQENEEYKKNALHYLSRTFVGLESRNSTFEKGVSTILLYKNALVPPALPHEADL